MSCDRTETSPAGVEMGVLPPVNLGRENLDHAVCAIRCVSRFVFSSSIHKTLINDGILRSLSGCGQGVETMK